MRKGSAIAFVVGLFLAAALLAAGCGGDDDNGGSATADGGGATTANIGGGGSTDGSSGGSDADSGSFAQGSNETGISKKAFLRKAEAICRDISFKAKAEVTAMTKNPNDPEAAFDELVERADEVVNNILAPRYREEIDRIRALGYPRGDEEEIEAMLTALEEVIHRAESEPDEFAQLNTVEGEPGNPYQRADDLAREYGFVVCPRV